MHLQCHFPAFSFPEALSCAFALCLDFCSAVAVRTANILITDKGFWVHVTVDVIRRLDLENGADRNSFGFGTWC